MPKPINWDLVDHLMRTYYPRQYQRILAAQQTTLPLPPPDEPTKGDTNRHGTRTQGTRKKRKAHHHSP